MTVSLTPDYDVLVSEGREQEKKYDWVEAVEPYKRASIVALELNDFSKAAEVYERIGFCLHRAAMQAKNPQEFKSRMVLASDAFSQAVRLLEKVERPSKTAQICHCEAMATYVSSWLELDSASRIRLLDECLELQKEALKFYKKIDDRVSLGKTYGDLSACLIDRLKLEWDEQMRRRMLMEALDCGEKAIDMLFELGEDYELARAYYTASIHYHTAASGFELEKRTEYEQKVLSYSKRGVELSEKIGDHFLLGMSSIWLGAAVADFAHRPDTAAKHFEKALQSGMVTRDNYLIGRASYLLAYLMAWKMVSEEDSEKIREESKRCEKFSKDAIHHFNSISCDQEIASSSYWRAENYNILAMSTETSLERKRSLLMKSINSARKGLEHARRSGSISATWFILHPLSKSLFYLSTMETDVDVKKGLLEESLRHRKENIKALEQAMPYYFWNQGVYHNYLALIQAELANVERGKEQKIRLLEEATESAENCIDLCLRHGTTLSRGQYAVLGGYYSDFGRILNQLYLLMETPELLGKLMGVFEGAVVAYEKADLPSRTAEARWQIATLYNKSGEYRKAAQNFGSASEDYQVVAERITPLSEFYLDHALYMQTWEEIEKGRYYHDIEEYAQSKVHYQKAANLYKTSKLWAYLAPNYSAWAQLENGEDLSRKEKSRQSIQAFQKAAQLFIRAKESLEEAIPKTQSSNEKNKAIELCKASDARREYCLGRTLLEEGKILNRVGEIQQSAERYGLAAKVFQRVTEAAATEPERNELLAIVYSCQAWEKMKSAERSVSAELFLQSSELFQKAKEHSSKEKTGLLALGNSAFCRALEAGTRFEVTRDLAFYSTAKQNMESSAHYYVKAGFEKASVWVNANEALLDAYLYMNTAESETVHEKKVQLYQLAEKYLERSVHLYGKAGYRAKRDEAFKILTKAKEKREFALSLGEALKAPYAASSTAAISVPTSTREEAVGLEKFEHANIQAYLDAPREVVVGETFEVRLDMANVAKEPGLLVRIENLVPSNFQVTETLPMLKLENGVVDMKGKRLEPQKVESLRIRVSTLQSGISHISPRIVYVDGVGKFTVCLPDPAAIAIYPPGKFQFKTNNAQRVFEYLTKAFVEDYMKRSLTQERSGWRTLMQIVESARTSKTSVYGAGAHRGPAISELQSRGVVDLRIFTEERGRGGKITKARVAYEKDIVKRYVDQQIMKIKEK